MRKLAVLLIVSIGMISAANAEIDFRKLTLSEGLEKAKAEKKLLFIDVYATWCGPCKDLSKTTFKDKDLGKFMNENFISIKVDGESEEGEMLMAKFNLDAYPTMIFIDGSMDLKEKIVGFVGPGVVEKGGTDALFPERTKLYKLSQRFENGARDKELLQSLISASLEKDRDVSELVEIHQDLFPVLDLTQRGDFSVFCLSSDRLDDELVKSFLSDIESLAKIHPEQSKTKIVQVITQMLEDATASEDEEIIRSGLDEVFDAYKLVMADSAHEKEKLLEILIEIYSNSV